MALRNNTSLLNDYTNFYNNCNKIKKQLKKQSKKLPGHWLYNKRYNLGFNILTTSTVSIGLGAAYLYFQSYIPFNIVPLALGGAIGAVSLALTLVTENILHKIIRKGKSNLSRTYCKMEFDEYFELITYNLKRKFKNLNKEDTLTYKSLRDLRNSTDLLNTYVENYNYDVEMLKNKIAKMKPKKQQKWQKMLDNVVVTQEYLNEHLQNFKNKLEPYNSIKTENLSKAELNEEIKIKPQTYTNFLIDEMKNEIQKAPSDFEQFKQYLLNKKQNNKNLYISKSPENEIQCL